MINLKDQDNPGNPKEKPYPVSKLIVPISVGLMCLSYTIVPSAKTGSSNAATARISPPAVTDSASFITDAAQYVYQSAGLQQSGLSEEAFTYAWKGYQYLLHKNLLSRGDYLSICDFSQPSSKKRLYIIDIAGNNLLVNTYVAHGRNSGTEYATRFSNRPESLQSSLGFYITQGTYIGEHGLSLRINGMEPGINNKAMERSIVIHGAAYVDGARALHGVFMGRSFGCPAVPQQESTKIIGLIKNGTCLFIYHPSRNYLLHSKILNG